MNKQKKKQRQAARKQAAAEAAAAAAAAPTSRLVNSKTMGANRLKQQVSSSGKGSKMKNTADQDEFDVISIIIIIIFHLFINIFNF